MVTLPIDSIKTLYQNNLIRGYEYVPSLVSFSDVIARTLRRAGSFTRHLDARSVPGASEWQVLDALMNCSMYKYPIAELNILNDPSDA